MEQTDPSARTEDGIRIPMTEVQAQPARLGHLPPGYDESTGSDAGLNVPARPATVVTVAERLLEVDLEEQSSPATCRERMAPGAVGRPGSMRRLMSSTESTSMT